jgi:hypothetical protein
MPNEITLYLFLVWLCVGFFTGAGWVLGSWIVGRLLR